MALKLMRQRPFGIGEEQWVVFDIAIVDPNPLATKRDRVKETKGFTSSFNAWAKSINPEEWFMVSLGPYHMTIGFKDRNDAMRFKLTWL